VLSFIIIWYLPLGGTVTLCSMIPICVVGLRYGAKWGLGTSFTYAVLQLFIGIVRDGLLGWGLTPLMLCGSIVLDYLLAYGLLGLVGLFRRLGEWGIYVGVSAVFALRLFCHFVSGFIIFQYLDQFEMLGKTLSGRPVLYSLCYNGMYMVPELVLSLVVLVILLRVPFVRKRIFNLQ